MRISFWNTRGLRITRAKYKLRSLVNSLNPTLVILAEPKVNYSSDFCEKLRLKGMHYEAIHNSTESRKENIWILWSASIKPQILVSSTEQSITVEVGNVLITGVHAASLTTDKRTLWREMEDVSSLDKPWLTIGDFNAVLREEEKKGGLRPLRISMLEFNNCLHSCGLIQVAKSAIPKPINVPFRALKVWINHPGFLTLIKESWNNNLQGNPIYIFMSKMKRLKIDIKDWNWSVFGDVNKNLKLAEKEVLDAIIISDQNPEIIHQLNKLVIARGRLEVLVQHQKEITQQKSRVMWLKEGASNSRFFHMNLKLRQSQSMIIQLENEDGNIISNQRDIAENLVAYFEDKFKFKEVYAWEFIGEDITNAIQYCWRRQFIPAGLNANFLKLIPKVSNANKEKQFRPIGLMNFSFKIFTKMLASRMGNIIQKIVSPQQGAFIKGRTIQEQITLASEMINELDTKRRGGNFGLKIDITQAYDSLSWKFLFQVMSKFGFSDKGIYWLQILLTSARIYVLVNGGPEGYFKVEIGLRQGDPLSPLLFVIVEDALSRNITKKIQNGELKAMVNRNGIQSSHILFADDIFLFCNDERRNVKNLMDMLKEYQNASGQIISLEKRIGGVVRDDAGSFVACYAKYIFQNESNVAEVWATRDGLVQDITDMKEKFEDVVFVHQYRESNFVADTLSKKAADRVFEGVWFTSPP
ncbi:uncharacterized protein LOC113354476 [Papaver somniferum]|uniref:uncharacterized protein LOC113354476 n=1 Tax=Papaver somniferum TaxID=3469 RepID=UPI000E70317B|nr:uncharacterized protein LOC113354476 [Papaver somniferum]